MSILKFKQFESSSLDYSFPSFQEVEDYFQDFFDEIDSKLQGYQSGFKFYLKPNIAHNHRNSTKLEYQIGYINIVSDKSNYVDILNTDIEDKKLEYLYNYCYTYNLNLPHHPSNDVCLNSIKNGAKAYKHLMIEFSNDSLFPKFKFDLLIECLKRLYLVEGFRPYGDIWSEYYVKHKNPGIDGKLEFQGMLVNCSDEEYIKMSQLTTSSKNLTLNKNLTKHFI